jgi:hypothetical protein
VAFVGVMAQAKDNPKGAPIDPPKPAAEIPVTDCIGMPSTKYPLRAFRGRVLVLVVFDSRFDGPGIAAPELNAMYDRLGPKGVSLLWLAAEEEKAAIDAWLKKFSVKNPAAIVDTPTKEKIILREYPYPGLPWTFIIDAEGRLVRHEHPQGLKDDMLTPLLDATTAPPVLPEALASVQPDLDAGLWAKARAGLQAAVDGGKLDKPGAGWAKGVAAWIEKRRSRTIAEGDALLAKGWYWDAWWVWDDFTRRYEGLEGCDVARQKADAVRADKTPACTDDMKNGDDIVKAKDFIAKGKMSPAKIILERISKLKPTRFADRAKELLPQAK